MTGIKQEILEPIISNPKAQMAVGSTMVAAGFTPSFVASLNPYIAFAGGILGIILTTVLIVKNIREIRK